MSNKVNSYLAVDIGASSGRHILGYIEDGRLQLEEIYRFENGFRKMDGYLCWDTEYLFNEIVKGIKKCKKSGKIPTTMGIDTWGTDYVLLDQQDCPIMPSISYRDQRTVGLEEKVDRYVDSKSLYERTGIQKLLFNTIYQLIAQKEEDMDVLKKTATLLMIPDYFHFRLTGVKKCEYTNATTTQLVNAVTKDWDWELIHKLGLPEKMFPPIIKPGTKIGELTAAIQEKVGFNCQVIVPATHDTASAVLAVPSHSWNNVYISSGTWSLIGIERKEPNCSEKSRSHNFTNEGGYGNRFCYLKNIMGLWMIQSVRNEFGRRKSFEEICSAAKKERISSLVDCSDQRFFSPRSMTKEIMNYCKETGQETPDNLAKLAAVIYNSLAVYYDKALQEIEEITGIDADVIRIVGGGANAEYLNELTVKYTGKTVLAGPQEATAIGNLIAQMITFGEISTVDQARDLISKSFEIVEYGLKGE